MDEKSRYEFFISEITTNKEVWLLKAHDGLYAMFEDNNNQTYLPVWPGKSYAEQFASDDWDNYTTESMGLTEFLNWMKELKEHDILIGAFPNENGQSMAIDPMEFSGRLHP
jgi:hypothetical protein